MSRFALPRLRRMWLLAALAACSLMPVENVAGEPQIETTLRRVDQFRRKAKLVILDEQVRVLDVSSSDAPRAIFKPNSSDAIVTSASGRIYVALSPWIWEIGPDEQARIIATLHGPNPGLGPGAFGDFFVVSADKSEFYFTLCRKIFPSGVCRLEAKSGRVTELLCGESIPADPGVVSIGFRGSGVDIDADLKTGTIFVPFNTTIAVRSFDEKQQRDLELHEIFDSCRIAPDGKKLLLSCEFDHPLALVDLAGWNGASLRINGADAVWGGDSVIYYVEPTTNSLRRYRLDDQLPERLVAVVRPDGKSGQSRLGLGRTKLHAPRMTRAPVVSDDGSWLAWGWSGAMNSNEYGEPHILVVDLANREYRSIHADWSRICWLEP
jgi:hypothetical protein